MSESREKYQEMSGKWKVQVDRGLVLEEEMNWAEPVQRKKEESMKKGVERWVKAD